MNISGKTIVARLAGVLTIALPLLAAAGSAFAAEGEAPPTAMDLVWKAVNLGVLIAVIVYFARKPVARFFRASASGAKESYDRTQTETEEATAEYEAQRNKLADLEAELNRMVDAARADAAEEREQLSREAEAQGERIRTQGRTQVEQEFAKARQALRGNLADEAVKLAEELIRARLDDERRRGLVADYIGELERAGQ